MYYIIQFNKTPLFYAILSGSNDVVKMLLDKEANIEAVDEVTNYIMSFTTKCDE